VNGSKIPTLNADNDIQCTGDKKLPLFSVLSVLRGKKHAPFLVFHTSMGVTLLVQVDPPGHDYTARAAHIIYSTYLPQISQYMHFVASN
jgi:hypothetical protein